MLCSQEDDKFCQSKVENNDCRTVKTGQNGLVIVIFSEITEIHRFHGILFKRLVRYNVMIMHRITNNKISF